MPHVIIEASRNIAETIDFPELVASIHRRLAETGILPVHAIKTRGLVHDVFAAGEPDRPGAAFLTTMIRIQPGRALEQEKKIAQTTLDVLHAAIEGVWSSPISISVDVQHVYREASVSSNLNFA